MARVNHPGVIVPGKIISHIQGLKSEEDGAKSASPFPENPSSLATPHRGNSRGDATRRSHKGRSRNQDELVLSFIDSD